MCEYFILEIFFSLKRDAARLELGEHLVVVLGVDDDGHVLIVLGRRSYHCGAADVDIFDALGKVGALGEGGLEGIEVDAHYIDGVYAQLFELFHMLRVGAHGKKSSVNVGVKGLYPAVETFGEARDFGYADDLEARLL